MVHVAMFPVCLSQHRQCQAWSLPCRAGLESQLVQKVPPAMAEPAQAHHPLGTWTQALVHWAVTQVVHWTVVGRCPKGNLSLKGHP